jgi:DNA replication and repair protein RecF
MAISQASRRYLRALSRYGRVLEQRNSLLRTFARDRVGLGATRQIEELAFWDAELAASGAEVLAQRVGAISRLGDCARRYFHLLTGDESLEVSYVTGRFSLPEDEVEGTEWQAPSQRLRQSFSAGLMAALSARRGEELRRGVTAVGPHRDDFTAFASGIDLARFGSRGQQRLAVIAIKLGELDLLDAAAGEPPVLLLDDVLSELDDRHRKEVVAMLAAREAQICVTATDAADLGATELAHLPMLRTDRGKVEPYDA